MAHRDNMLVWLDLEMTGLDPEECSIVQMAVIITDPDLKEVDVPLELTIWQPESELAKMSPYVRSMHEKSGLLASISRSQVALREAEEEAMALISKYCSYRTARLCGNSIGQDRRFLVKYMPALENYLHYRQIDVSSVKELALWWYGVKFDKPNNGKHTALADVKHSLDELRFYRDRIFATR